MIASPIRLVKPSTVILRIALLFASLTDPTHAVGENYVVGLLRVEFAPLEAKPQVEPIATLRAAGISTDFLGAYDEQANINGAVEQPILLAGSSNESAGRWCDVVVPFSTEDFWITTLKELDGVTDVRRKPLHAARGTEPTAPELSIPQARIDQIKAPYLELKLRGSVGKKAIDQFYSFGETFYGQKPAELHALGATQGNKARYFAFDHLHRRLFDDPPWQRLRIMVSIDESVAGRPLLRVIFTGGAAFGAPFIKPPDIKYENLLSDQNVEARFREHVERFGGALHAELAKLGSIAE